MRTRYSIPMIRISDIAPRKSRTRKTKKRLAIKAEMLAAKAAKRRTKKK